MATVPIASSCARERARRAAGPEQRGRRVGCEASCGDKILPKMPLFDFRCRACSEEFEALVRPGAAPACPACAATDLERLLSGFSFSVRSGGLSPAARKAVQKQQT